MNRLQQKCFLASTGVHLLLALILFVGPAFLSSPNRSDNSPILDIIPSKLIDAPFSGGGNPNPKPPPQSPATPSPVAPPVQSQAKPEPVKLPEPPELKPVVRNEVTENQDPDSLETKETKKKPQISLTPVI